MLQTNKKWKKLKIPLLLLILFILIFGIAMFINLGKNSKVKKNRNLVASFEYPDIVKEGVVPNDVYGTPVHTQYIDINTPARPGIKRLILFIVIHETANSDRGADAANHANFLSYNNTSSTSWHYTVDDKEIYHHIPDDEVAYHAGELSGNNFGIGIELCINKDGNFDKTFENGAKLTAYLLKAYSLDLNDIKTHHDFTGKDCPSIILKNNAFDKFKQRVKFYLENN